MARRLARDAGARPSGDHRVTASSSVPSSVRMPRRRRLLTSAPPAAGPTPIGVAATATASDRDRPHDPVAGVVTRCTADERDRGSRPATTSRSISTQMPGAYGELAEAGAVGVHDIHPLRRRRPRGSVVGDLDPSGDQRAGSDLALAAGGRHAEQLLCAASSSRSDELRAGVGRRARTGPAARPAAGTASGSTWTSVPEDRRRRRPVEVVAREPHRPRRRRGSSARPAPTRTDSGVPKRSGRC